MFKIGSTTCYEDGHVCNNKLSKILLLLFVSRFDNFLYKMARPNSILIQRMQTINYDFLSYPKILDMIKTNRLMQRPIYILHIEQRNRT